MTETINPYAILNGTIVDLQFRKPYHNWGNVGISALEECIDECDAITTVVLGRMEKTYFILPHSRSDRVVPCRNRFLVYNFSRPRHVMLLR